MPVPTQAIDVMSLTLMAFDRVSHQLLLQKLIYYNVNPTVINWIKSFLCFRKQRVKLNGFFYEWHDVVEFHTGNNLRSYSVYNVY